MPRLMVSVPVITYRFQFWCWFGGLKRGLNLLLPEPEPDAVDAELLPGEGVPGMGSGDGSGIAETTESTNGWGCNEEKCHREHMYVNINVPMNF